MEPELKLPWVKRGDDFYSSPDGGATSQPAAYTCTRCGTTKPAKEFIPKNRSRCRKCLSQDCIKRQQTDRGKLLHMLKNMIYRCHNPKSRAFKRYGARGITVCDDWRNNHESFVAFAIGTGWRPDLTIDRIDNDKGYAPDNVRWVGVKEQNRNQSRNRLLTIDGVTRCLSEWSEVSGRNDDTIRQRLRRGWTHKDAVWGKLKVNGAG